MLKPAIHEDKWLWNALISMFYFAERLKEFEKTTDILKYILGTQ
jgi:hypothetical protein